MCFWDLAEANMTSSFKAHDGPVLCVRFFEKIMVTAAADGSLKVWQVTLAPSVGIHAGAAALLPSGNGLPSSFGRPTKRSPAWHFNSIEEGRKTSSINTAAQASPAV